MTNDHCESCRRALWRALEGHHDDGRLAELRFDRHVLACSECRELLEREMALEVLLSHLPEPHLSADLAGRLIARLRRSLQPAPEADPLDRLLDRVEEPAVPAGLAASVLSALRAERDADPLDRLLERVPAPRPPAELASSLLAELAWARRRPARVPRLAWSAAAAVLVALAAAFAFLGGPDPAAPPEPELAAALQPDDLELIEHLVVLENWELLVADDLELLLSSADPLDELLLELGTEPEATEPVNDATHG